jgi:Ricin-type beta-trefoil lectin domain
MPGIPHPGRFLVASVAVIGLGLMALTQNASAYLPSRLYNAGSGTCMSSLGTHTDGADAVLWQCNGSPNQTWVNAPASGGGTILMAAGDGWCLNNFRGRFANYNPQTMWPCNNTGGASNWKQSYYISGSGVARGYYNIQTVNSSDHISGYCLTSLGKRYNGALVEETPCNNRAPNQAWEGLTLTPP